jgi:CRP-like cAMP-binding protein
MSNENVAEKLLKRVPLFEKLSESEIKAITVLVKPLKFPDSHEIITEGSEGNDLFVILQGEVRVSKFVNGKEEAITFLKKGALFGEMALLGNMKRTAAVISHGETVVYKINGDKFLKFMEENPAAGYIIMRQTAVNLAKRLKELNDRYQSILSMAFI